MSEEENWRRMQEARENPPLWKRRLLGHIDKIAQQPEAVDVFRTHIKAVAKNLVAEREQKRRLPPLGQGEHMSLTDYKAHYEVKNLFGIGPALSLPEKYFVLAAFHDAFCEAERMSPIMPEEWQGDVMRLVNYQGQQTEWFRTPDYAAYLMYESCSDQCADLPEQQLQPAILVRFLDELRADLEAVVSGRNRPLVPNGQSSFRRKATGPIFIGHGQSEAWTALKDFIVDDLELDYEEFDKEPAAGRIITTRLDEMLNKCCFAFLVMTAEDERLDGKKQARPNVVHELGMCQSRYGSEKAIILLEEGCEKFSNINGLVYIQFPKGNILAKSKDIRRVLERERILPKHKPIRGKADSRRLRRGAADDAPPID